VVRGIAILAALRSIVAAFAAILIGVGRTVAALHEEPTDAERGHRRRDRILLDRAEEAGTGIPGRTAEITYHALCPPDRRLTHVVLDDVHLIMDGLCDLLFEAIRVQFLLDRVNRAAHIGARLLDILPNHLRGFLLRRRCDVAGGVVEISLGRLRDIL